MIKTIEQARAVQARRESSFTYHVVGYNPDGQPVCTREVGEPLRGVAKAVRRFLKRNQMTAGDLR